MQTPTENLSRGPQICYLPLFVTPQGNGTTNVTASQLLPLASMPGLQLPFLLQLPAIPQTPSLVAPATAPAATNQLPTLPALAPANLPQGLSALRLSNLASLLPAPPTPAPAAPLSLTLPGLASALVLPHALPGSAMPGFSVDGLDVAPASGKKEIKFKYHMSLMPQLTAPPTAPKPEIKKKRKPRMRITGRVCTHCGASQTTEWRMGPEGRGTLCNACGLRYRKKLLADGRKDPNAKISMSMLLNTNKKNSNPKNGSATKESSDAIKVEEKN